MKAEFAAAKINLFLQLTGRRADGYHTLNSLVVFADVGDVLRVSHAQSTCFSITGHFAPSLQQEADSNLVMLAHKAVEEYVGTAIPLSITLEKNLPVASGIGGGSADAAAMLRVLKEQCNDALPEDVVRDIALSLGADVWVCYHSKPAWVSGIGEHVRLLSAFPEYGIVLLNPLKSLPTKAVFTAFSGAMCEEETLMPPADKSAWVKYLFSHRNSLEAPAIAIMPEIQVLLNAMQETPQCLLARMSGSGATCFGLYESHKQAIDAALELKRKFPHYWIEAGKVYGA